MLTGRHLAFVGPGIPLELRTDEAPDPGPDSLIARVSLAGVCGTDGHRLAGDLAAPPAPISFGHEAVGVIEELGADVSTDSNETPVKVGDRIYWFPPAPCGHCHWCLEGDGASACEKTAWPVPADKPNPAGFREVSTLGPNVAFYRVPDHVSDEAVIAFGCAMPTALCGFERLGPIPVGSTVVIQGSGPVGLASALLANLSVAGQIIVIGAPDNRLEFSRRFGASETISLESMSAEERRRVVLERTGGRGADVVVEAAGNLPAFGEGVDLLGRNGRYLVMGLYSGPRKTDFDPIRLNNYSQQLIGTMGMTTRHIYGNVQLAARLGDRMGFADLVTHRFPLERTEEAIAAASSGEAIKAVVTPSDPA